MEDLFGGLPTYQTSDGRTVEVKKRGKHYVEPRGGADRPGTGPHLPETAGEGLPQVRSYSRLLDRRRQDRHTGAMGCLQQMGKSED
jgi:hypothetical protein